MRTLTIIAALAAATPASGWEFTQDILCRLTHETGTATVEVTYDPANMQYAIHLARGVPWPDAPVFAIAFEGIRPLTISTDRHTLSDEGQTLSVYDRGFGNVLNGLEFNTRATAVAGEAALVMSLAGAAPEVERFRGCTTARLS